MHIGRYWLIDQNMDWKSAAEYCNKKNTGLAAIMSEREQRAVKNVLDRKHGKFVCCGVETWVQLLHSSMKRDPEPELLKVSSGETTAFHKGITVILQQCPKSIKFLAAAYGRSLPNLTGDWGTCIVPLAPNCGIYNTK